MEVVSDKHIVRVEEGRLISFRSHTTELSRLGKGYLRAAVRYPEDKPRPRHPFYPRTGRFRQRFEQLQPDPALAVEAECPRHFFLGVLRKIPVTLILKLLKESVGFSNQCLPSLRVVRFA